MPEGLPPTKKKKPIMPVKMRKIIQDIKMEFNKEKH